VSLTFLAGYNHGKSNTKATISVKEERLSNMDHFDASNFVCQKLIFVPAQVE
jgi:hypothetical protein